MNQEELINKVDQLIQNLDKRGWGDKNKLFYKLVEEVGEYSEACSYANGSTAKIAKFKDKATPIQKLHEEIVDVIMMGFALAYQDGLEVEDVLERIAEKLEGKENNGK